METELDIAADHLVEWLRDDLKSAARPRFEISASRSFVSEPVVDMAAALSDEEEVAAMAAIGVLEVTPAPATGGRWMLRLRVEDVVGPHLPDDGSVPDEPEELTLDAFEADFVLPDRGTAFVTLETASNQDRRRFDAIFAELLTDRHRR